VTGVQTCALPISSGETVTLTPSTPGVAQTPNVILSLFGTSDAGNTKAVIPENTTITSSNPAWDGTVHVPTLTNFTVPGAANTSLAITVGSDSYSLTFDHAVQLYFPGKGGQSIGFKTPTGPFTEITATCDTFDPATADSQLATLGANECKMSYNGDLYVWTKHFTLFATYTKLQAVTSQSTTSSTTTTTVAKTAASTTSNNATDAVDTVASVLGAASGIASDTTKKAATTTSPEKKTDDSSAFLGLGWWWLVVLAAVLVAAGVGGNRYLNSTSKR
jgi:hypothetical protein